MVSVVRSRAYEKNWPSSSMRLTERHGPCYIVVMQIQYSTDKKSEKGNPQRLIAIVYHIHIYTCALLVLVLVRMNRPKRGGLCYSWPVDKCVVAELSRERDISKSQLRARAWKDTTHRLVHCTFTTYQLWLVKGMESFERRHPATNSLSLGSPPNSTPSTKTSDTRPGGNYAIHSSTHVPVPCPTRSAAAQWASW